MHERLKYKLIRITSEFLVVTTLATGISHLGTKIKYPKEVIPYTQEDIDKNIEFEKELKRIQKEIKISFKNEELERIIQKQIKGSVTNQSILTITELEITDKLKDNDLSDLKYLQQLRKLKINNNDIDIEELKYNQNLISVEFCTCNLTNFSCLPNSIETLYVDDSIILDKEVIIPYYTKNVLFKKSIANNIKFKNPSVLESLLITSDIMFDMNNLKDCKKLKNLTIIMSSNIKNSHVLKELSSLESVILDEYAAIWLDSQTLNTLPIEEERKKVLQDIISKLDSIANAIVKDPNMSEKEKINRVTLYLLEKLEYDYEAMQAEDSIDDRVEIYNCNPLSTSLEGDLGICINYSAMFQALSNRVGLDTYQLANDVHAWNATKIDGEYKGFDLTYLELGPIVSINELGHFGVLSTTTVEDMLRTGNQDKLYYYEFDLDKIIDDNHLANYTPQEIKNSVLNIGFINENSLAKIIYKNQETYFKLSLFEKSLLILSLSAIVLEASIQYKHKKRNKKMLRK